MSKPHRQRDFVFTCNNYTTQHEESIQALKSKYLIYGYELAPTTGTPHLQGYIYFENTRTLSAVIKKMKDCHVEFAKGTTSQNYVYCTKSEKFFESGERPKESGKRTDIESIKILAKSGAKDQDIAEAATSYQALKFGLYLKQFHRPLKVKPIVYWFHGESGSGKTRKAFELYPDAYWHDTGKWFCNYHEQDVAIFDDLRPNCFPFNYLLRLLDRYPMTVETKGSTTQWNPKIIIITSCMSPDKFVPLGEDPKQLLRRIDEIELFLSDFSSSINGISSEEEILQEESSETQIAHKNKILAQIGTVDRQECD